ncbi:ATP12 family chaperone protein [Pseudoruegeria sp. HB172150]|uniref:ATP12 family chaperone protein n=1 Tax=Pseudoruegeria sp. HB172150 TaxID=2721164 RepID=UPI0015552812|nr:ATP12 family protein [Pseudoruegeria sp. HB172150]
MSGWKARRFWTSVQIEDHPQGFAVRLDGRPVKTPGKLELAVPTEALAKEIAREWEAQEGVIDPRSMPYTRAANSAIEKVTPQRAEVAEMLAAYGDSDLTCYRADLPEALAQRQSEAWDPLLDWAAETFGARLIPVQGVMHQPQPPAALAALAAPVHAMIPWELTGFHDLVALSGSLVIGLAAVRNHLSPRELWDRSRIDETWQEEQWGADDEATAMADAKRADFFQAHRFFQLLT